MKAGIDFRQLAELERRPVHVARQEPAELVRELRRCDVETVVEGVLAIDRVDQVVDLDHEVVDRHREIAGFAEVAVEHRAECPAVRLLRLEVLVALAGEAADALLFRQRQREGPGRGDAVGDRRDRAAVLGDVAGRRRSHVVAGIGDRREVFAARRKQLADVRRTHGMRELRAEPQ